MLAKKIASTFLQLTIVSALLFVLITLVGKSASAQVQFCPTAQSGLFVGIAGNGHIEFWRGTTLVYRDAQDGVSQMGGKTGLDCADVYSNKHMIAIRLGWKNDRVYLYGLKQNAHGELLGIDRAFHQSLGTAIAFHPNDRTMLLQFGASGDVWISFCWTSSNLWTFAHHPANPGIHRDQNLRGGACTDPVPPVGVFPYPFLHNLALSVQTPFSIDGQILNISHHPSTQVDQNETLRIVNGVNSLFASVDGAGDIACDVRFQHGVIRSFPSAPININSRNDLDLVFNTPGAIKIVNEINYCGGQTNPNIVGCAASGYHQMVVERSAGVQTWAHEIGHSRGLGHRIGTQFLMNAERTLTTRQINADECEALTVALAPPRPGLSSTGGIVWIPVYEDWLSKFRRIKGTEAPVK